LKTHGEDSPRLTSGKNMGAKLELQDAVFVFFIDNHRPLYHNLKEFYMYKLLKLNIKI